MPRLIAAKATGPEAGPLGKPMRRSGDNEAARDIRDLMGLLALPAMWAGRDGPGLLRVMAEAIETMVPLSFSYAALGMLPGTAAVVRLRVDGMPISGELLATWQDAMAGWPQSSVSNARVHVCSTPLGQMRVVLLSLGYMSTAGNIWFGSSAPNFPTMQQLALLRAAATLAATGLQTARINFEREAASRAKDEFLAMLGHELRNPLAPISAAADLLQLASLDAVQLKQTSDIIARQVVHMTSLINDLLDVSRVTSGLVLIEKTELDLKTVVMEAIEQVRPTIDARGQRFSTRFQNDPVSVEGDHKRLVQVLTNLLSNAAKYTPEGGNIVLEVKASEIDVTIVVSDDGIGIDPVLISTIFDLFTQAKRSSDRSQGGLGLGLALVKSLTELHGGTVTASSGGEGAGSTFTVCLSRLPAAAPAAAQAALLAPGCTDHPLRIMVVDDNADGAFMVAMLLETLGHEVLVENDAYKALERAVSARPDVCLLDIGLPGMDGNELARRLRAMPETRNTMLIALTGYGQESDRVRSLQAGFDHHFVKPIDVARLAPLLADMAARRRV